MPLIDEKDGTNFITVSKYVIWFRQGRTAFKRQLEEGNGVDCGKLPTYPRKWLQNQRCYNWLGFMAERGLWLDKTGRLKD